MNTIAQKVTEDITITGSYAMSRRVKATALFLFFAAVFIGGMFLVHQVKAYGCREDPVTATVPECGDSK